MNLRMQIVPFKNAVCTAFLFFKILFKGFALENPDLRASPLKIPFKGFALENPSRGFAPAPHHF